MSELTVDPRIVTTTNNACKPHRGSHNLPGKKDLKRISRILKIYPRFFSSSGAYSFCCPCHVKIFSFDRFLHILPNRSGCQMATCSRGSGGVGRVSGARMNSLPMGLPAAGKPCSRAFGLRMAGMFVSAASQHRCAKRGAKAPCQF